MFTQYNHETGKTTLTKLAKGGIITVTAIASLGIFRLTAVKRIPANTVGVKVSAIGGVQENTLQTGYHLKMPFIDKVYTLSTSVQTKTMEKITTQTKDGQWLNTNIDVKYRVNKEKAMTVFSNYTDLENVNNSVVSPAVQRAIESVTGNYDIYDILGNKRTEVYEAIDKALKQEQEKAKVEANTKKVQAQAEADAGIIKAEGEAKANKAKSDSITDNLIRMKEAEAREKHGWVTVNGAGSVITNHE